MFRENMRPAPLSMFQEFEKEDMTLEPVDSFKGELIAAYERALEEGIEPIAALSAVIDWASQEIKRCSMPEQARS
jgi:hypothetical protein